MTESILNSVKKTLNLLADDQSFDQDVILYINSALSNLNQLGVGPDSGFMITGNTETWETFLGNDPRLNNVKTYVCLTVRMLFDPPTTGFLVTAMKEQLQELAWLINVRREETGWTDPLLDPEPAQVLDGGVL